MRDTRRTNRKRRLSGRERFLRCAIAVLLCAGIAVQTVLFINLAGKNRETAHLRAEIEQLNSDAVNYQLVIGSNGDRTALKDRAINVLGMKEPSAEEIRVVRLPVAASTDTQLVMNDPAQ